MHKKSALTVILETSRRMASKPSDNDISALIVRKASRIILGKVFWKSGFGMNLFGKGKL